MPCAVKYFTQRTSMAKLRPRNLGLAVEQTARHAVVVSCNAVRLSFVFFQTQENMNETFLRVSAFCDYDQLFDYWK